jgi:hypothetical protein
MRGGIRLLQGNSKFYMDLQGKPNPNQGLEFGWHEMKKRIHGCGQPDEQFRKSGRPAEGRSRTWNV